MSYGGTVANSPVGADALLKRLETDPATWPAASAALRRLRGHVAGETLAGGQRFHISTPHRLMGHLVPDDAAAELASLNAHPQLLLAAAAISLLDDDVWGECETVLELASYGNDLVREREGLRAELAEVVTLADPVFRETTRAERDAGPVRHVFRIAPSVHVGEGWQERLVDHLLAVRSAEAA